MHLVCQIKQFLRKSEESIQLVKQASLDLTGASQPYDKTFQLVEHLYESIFGVISNQLELKDQVNKLLFDIKKVKAIVRQNEKRFITFEKEYKSLLKLGRTQIIHYEDA